MMTQQLPLPTGDLVYSTLHGRLVRVLRTEPDGMVVVGDRHTLRELPDYVNLTQLRRSPGRGLEPQYRPQ